MKQTDEGKRSRCATRIRPGDVRSLAKYLERLNPCDYEEFLPMFFADTGDAPSWFDPERPLGFFGRRLTPWSLRWDFFRWLSKNIYRDEIRLSDRFRDSAFHYERPRLLPAKSWLVHFSHPDTLAQIVRDGFRGTADHARLVSTYNLEKVLDGWNFGYPVEHSAHADRTDLWGPAALLLKAPAVFVYHRNDDDYQAIFWGPRVKRAIVLAKSRRMQVWPSTAPWDVFGADRAVAHRATSYEAAVAWAMKHARDLWAPVGE